MGTNYYRARRITTADKEAMHQLIDKGLILSQKTGWHDEDIPDALQDVVSKLGEQIHICKMSCGWKTCFDHNWGKYYQPNRKSIENFLKEPNTYIVNEYGTEIPYKKFWDMVKEHDTTKRIDGGKPFVSKTYDQWERERNPSYHSYFCSEDIVKCSEVFGIETDSNDFEVDGLRFAVFSDFS